MTDKKKHIDVSIIQAYVEGSISLKQASVMLERTPRTVMRMAAKYRDFGADGLIHGNTGKEPHNKIDSSIRQKILAAMSHESLRLMPYNLAVHYLRYEGLEVSAETLRQLLKEDPALQQERKSSLHPLRRRRAQFGELIQLDGSPHHWFGPHRDRACLMVFIDDATSRITAAQFAPTENSLSYRELIEQHVWRYGIPLAFYSDKHGIFTVGAALNAGTGSVRGQGTGDGTKSEVDYWGLNLYGAWATSWVDLIGTVGYLTSDNDISHGGFSADTDVDAYTVALRAQRTSPLNEAFSVTPHIGVRWNHIEVDSFTAGGFTYESDDVDLVQVSIGVAFSGNTTMVTFDVKHYLDLEVAATFGDKDTDNRVGLEASALEDVIDTRIASSVVWTARMGLEATSGAHSIGLRYDVSAGNGDRVDQRLTAGYKFSF